MGDEIGNGVDRAGEHDDRGDGGGHEQGRIYEAQEDGVLKASADDVEDHQKPRRLVEGPRGQIREVSDAHGAGQHVSQNGDHTVHQRFPDTEGAEGDGITQLVAVRVGIIRVEIKDPVLSQLRGGEIQLEHIAGIP